MTHRNDYIAALRRGGRTAVIAFLAALAFASTTSRSVAQTTTSEQVENARAALEKWVETRRIISKEKADWSLARETQIERIQILKRDIEAMRAKIEETNKSIAEADQKRQELMQENERLKTVSADLVAKVSKLESRTKDVLSKLPEPIREQVKPISQSIPEKPEETKTPVTQRFVNVVAILNEINKFNRDMKMSPEVRKLPDGTSVEVTTLYVGLGQGWYAGGNGLIAGIGTSGPEGWIWRPANESAASISKVISIHKNEDTAAFVKVPVVVQ